MRLQIEGTQDGTYTIYPNQSGTPHIFEPIEAEEIEAIYDTINRFLSEKTGVSVEFPRKVEE